MKDLWALYLTSIEIKPPNRGSEEGRESEGDEKEFYSPISENSAEELLSDSDEPKSPQKAEREKAYRSNLSQLKKYPPLLISPLFSYIGMIIIKLPVTINNIFKYGLYF